jgi:hypothetical protein
MRNFVKSQDLVTTTTNVEEWKASRVPLSKMEKWLDKAVEKDAELSATLVNMRKFNVKNESERNSYEEHLTFFMSKYLKNMGAEAVAPKDSKSMLPDIKFGKLDSASHSALSNNALGANVSMATYDNQILTQNNMIIGMYDQITPVNASPIMQEFPEAMYPAVGLFIASWEQITGMTAQHITGQPFYNVPKRKVNYQFFKTAPHAEKVVWQQEEVIGLKNPSSNTFMDRGLPLYMAKNTAMLEHRRQTRDVFNIYRAIFDDVSYYNGNALSYNISPLNRLTGTQLGGEPWVTFNAVNGAINSFGNVNIPQAFRNLVHAFLRKYTGYTLKMYMSSPTLSALIGNPSITPITNFGPAMRVAGNPSESGQAQFATILKQFLGTSANIEIVIDDSQYVADDKDPMGRIAGETYWLLDLGKIVVLPQVQSTGAGMGEYAYTPIVQNGGMLNPQAGAAFFMIDTFASNTTEGMENPSLANALRYSAIPMIFRTRDLFTIDITK